MKESKPKQLKEAFAFTPKQANTHYNTPRNEIKGRQLKQIRDVTKPVYKELNSYFMSIRGTLPTFGYPAINFEDNHSSSESVWALISK